MCIRDSRISAQSLADTGACQNAHSQRSASGRNSGAFRRPGADAYLGRAAIWRSLGGADTVSYTHLDVYKRQVLAPINKLNVAMQNIAEGNFEYRLTSEDTREIGELYRNYEDMRLRLKESTEEKKQNEQQNRELISNITHDLKTPITAIKGYVEGIKMCIRDRR